MIQNSTSQLKHSAVIVIPLNVTGINGKGAKLTEKIDLSSSVPGLGNQQQQQPSSMIAMIEQVINAVTARQPIQRRCGHCNAVGHDRRTCATRFREVEERAIGHPVTIVHADNKEELKRLRALTSTRLLEEAVQERAQALQESENRAQDRARARQALEREEAQAAQAEARRIRDEYLARRQVFDQQRVQEEHDPHMPDLIARHQQREAVDQRLEAALEGLAQFDSALQRREVELARQERDRIAWRRREARQLVEQPAFARAQHAGEMRRLGVEEQRARQLVEQPAFARAMQNAMQADQQPPLRATENELARMVALPVLRETAVEATECPICIEDLGEVGKTVLKCGHTVCVSCFLQQMMRATAETRARECACPVCRVNYIM
jgi:hypothetical protein